MNYLNSIAFFKGRSCPIAPTHHGMVQFNSDSLDRKVQIGDKLGEG
jgi:hypothetical protein